MLSRAGTTGHVQPCVQASGVFACFPAQLLLLSQQKTNTAHLQVHHVECAPQLPQDEHLPLNVLQVLLLLDGRQVGHIQTLADALAGKLCTRRPAAHNPHAAEASLAQLPASLGAKITEKVTIWLF
jgi:hypothetical protein